MHRFKSADLAALILRIGLGWVVLAHSIYLKFWVFTLPGTAHFFETLGLPGAMAYLVFFVEVISGIALLLGIQTLVASTVLIPVFVGATWAHWPAGWLFTNPNGGWEYPMFLTVAAMVQALLGNGVYALGDHPFKQLNLAFNSSK